MITHEVTFDSVMRAVKELNGKLLPPPTAEQREWARRRGYPDFPGFKVSSDVLAQFKTARSVGFFPFMDRLCLSSIPIAADPMLLPGTVLSAEEEWKSVLKT